MYISAPVQAIQRLHQHRQGHYAGTVMEDLSGRVDDLLEHQIDQVLAVATYLTNGHPEYAGQATHHIPFGSVTRADFEKAVARTVGYRNWFGVEREIKLLDPDFERAVDLLLAGDKEALAAMLTQKPDLINQSSAYGHRAGLIHYVGANGVELWRQQVPANLPEMLQLLLDHGADPQQAHNIYQGNGDVRALIETSAHPKDAGISAELLQVL